MTAYGSLDPINKKYSSEAPQLLLLVTFASVDINRLDLCPPGHTSAALTDAAVVAVSNGKLNRPL
jgi:hypothetical protein